MSKNLSAVKRNQISSRNRVRNRIYKSTIKTLTRKYFISIYKLNNANYDNALLNLSTVYSAIDKAVKRGILHKNNAARKKALLARAMKHALS